MQAQELHPRMCNYTVQGGFLYELIHFIMSIKIMPISWGIVVHYCVPNVQIGNIFSLVSIHYWNLPCLGWPLHPTSPQPHSHTCFMPRHWLEQVKVMPCGKQRPSPVCSGSSAPQLSSACSAPADRSYWGHHLCISLSTDTRAFPGFLQISEKQELFHSSPSPPHILRYHK